MKIEKAKITDAPEIHRLINYFADKGEMLPRALSEVYEDIRDFFITRDGAQVVACVALHVSWADLAEVRGLAVSEERQREGIGGALVQACLDEARELGIYTVFCLTYQPKFFNTCGFREIDKSELPRKVWGECLRCPKFPDCDELAMITHLDGPRPKEQLPLME